MKGGIPMVSFAMAAFLVFLPAIIGSAAEEITKDKILSTGKEWQEKYDQYQPEADMVEALKARLTADTKVDVYLGLWCPDSRNNVPPFIKILDRLGGAVPVRYTDVPRKAGKDVKYYFEALQVERVPTFIVYRKGKEIGRIVENPKVGMLEDLMEIVFKED